jgi:glycosyltransferase involved in cell wall biosynthesis
MTKRISIITITKDDPHGLKRTAESLAVQHGGIEAVEWLVVNGSPDNQDVLSVMDQYKPMMSWSQSAHDGGLFQAMNIGMAKVSTPWQWYMNSGDTLGSPTILTTVLQTINANPSMDFLYGDAALGKNKVRTRAYRVDQSPHHMVTCHQSMIFNTQVIGSQQYPLTYKIGNDYQFMADYLKKSRNPVYVPEIFSNFQGDGISDQKHLVAVKECFQIRQRSGQVGLLENVKLSLPGLISCAMKSICPDVLHEFTRDAYRALKNPRATSAKAEICPLTPMDEADKLCEIMPKFKPSLDH